MRNIDELAFIILEQVNRNRNQEYGTTIRVQNMNAGRLYMYVWCLSKISRSDLLIC